MENSNTSNNDDIPRLTVVKDPREELQEVCKYTYIP